MELTISCKSLFVKAILSKVKKMYIDFSKCVRKGNFSLANDVNLGVRKGSLIIIDAALFGIG